MLKYGGEAALLSIVRRSGPIHHVTPMFDLMS
jgi:hypothetical protein